MGENEEVEYVEDTPEWLYDSLSKGEKIEWKYTGDPDTFSAKHRGRYYLIDSTTETGRNLLKRLQKAGGKESALRIPDSKLPPKGIVEKGPKDSGELKVEAPEYSDQAFGKPSFLGMSSLGPQDSPTQSMCAPTPTTLTSDSAGPRRVLKQFGSRMKSTSSMPITESAPPTLNLARRLFASYENLPYGDQVFLAQALTTQLSGLTPDLRKSFQNLIGKLPSDPVV